MKLEPNISDRLAEKVREIVEVETAIRKKFQAKEFRGTAHLCFGQEKAAAGISLALDQSDMLFGNHRSHGFIIARGFTRNLMDALEKGEGGSQHIGTYNTLVNGIVGGTVPVAVGYGLALRLKKSPNCSVVVFGDGALGQGVLYESLNMAAIWKARVIFVCMNNGIAQTTDGDLIPGSIEGRAEAFGVPWSRRTDPSALEAYDLSREIKERELYPHFVEIVCKRSCGHSVNR